MVTIQDFDVDYADQLYILAVDSLKKTALLTEALFHREHIQENYDKIYEVYQNSFQLLFQKVKQELREMDKQKAEYDRNRTNKYQKKWRIIIKQDG